MLGSDADGIVLRAAFNVPVVELGFTTFRRGDVFVEFYYFERWYNVFQVRAPDGELKGYYANVGLPAELDAAAGELRYVDLALDVWVAPDGSFLVLDEDEFEQLLRLWPALADGARRGRAELLALVEAGQLPSWSAEC